MDWVEAESCLGAGYVQVWPRLLCGCVIMACIGFSAVQFIRHPATCSGDSGESRVKLLNVLSLSPNHLSLLRLTETFKPD